MSYQVIARKFRPQSFSEFVGQSHVTQTLVNALESDRFPHAILLTGPRGTGKTTTARIIAKTILCQNRQGQNPCGECPSCVDIADGKHMDVIEIDGASNNGVDHIRELRDTIGYMPSSGSHKVYIIDEVHLLSTSAFNALLKTLEEPPEHVIFIFATTEVQKIPATILSRCQRFDFRNHTLTDIRAHLQNICEQEGIEFDDNALLMIAKQANGSIRDSLTLLDQLISFSDKKLTLEAVMTVLGLTDRTLLFSCLKAIADNDSHLMFQSLDHFKNSGYDPLLFAEEFLEVIRNALLVKLECHKQQNLDISEGEISDLEEVTKKLGQAEIHLIFDVMVAGTQKISRMTDATLGLEMLLFKLLHLPRLSQGLQVPTQQSSSQLPTTPTSNKSQASAVSQPRTAPIEKPQRAPQKTTTPAAAAPAPAPAKPVGKTWEEFVRAVKQANGFLGALLEHTSIFKQDDEVIHLGLPEKMSFLLDKLKEEKNLERTQNFLVNFWSDNRKVEVELLDKNHTHEKLSPKAMEEQARRSQEKKEKDTIDSHPLVKAAEEVFKDNITKVGVTNAPTRNP